MGAQNDGQIEPPQRRDPKSNAATGVSAAGVRALATQVVAFYFRAPVKAFFRTRVDYLAVARAINPRVQASEAWSWRTSTPGLLTHAVKIYGWGFIPNQILPPLLANISIGAILYTTYLQSLGALHQPSSRSTQRIYPPPPPQNTLMAGFIAGAIQSVVAAPLDALQVRFRTSYITEGHYKNMWHYGYRQLKDIGARGVFAGWGLSLVKDTLGYAAFFATFEYIKAQTYYKFLIIYYGKSRSNNPRQAARPRVDSTYDSLVIKPHYAIEPVFLMLAGIAASVAQQLIQHPIGIIQNVHYRSFATLDGVIKNHHSTSQIVRRYCDTYGKTYKRCQLFAKEHQGWRRWLYRGFFWSTIRQVPSTSAGLIIFELARRRFSTDSEIVEIQKDGYNIRLI